LNVNPLPVKVVGSESALLSKRKKEKVSEQRERLGPTIANEL
jgi:hypothetical protein